MGAAIQEGIVAGAALDVFVEEPVKPDFPLIKLDNVVCTPHLGASTDEAQENVAVEVAEQMVEYFVKGVVKNAVNYPSISGELASVLKPFISLAEKLGKLQGQLASSFPQEIQVRYYGELAEYPMASVTVSILKGILESSLEGENVNFVNAPFIAKERGIQVTESKVSDTKDFKTLIEVIVKTAEGTRTVSGTIFGKNNPRIVRIDDFYLEAVPEGTILVIHNQDKPGVVGNIGTLLGKNQVNISRMQLGLLKDKGEAIALYNVDNKVPEDLVKEISKLPNILKVTQVAL